MLNGNHVTFLEYIGKGSYAVLGKDAFKNDVLENCMNRGV